MSRYDARFWFAPGVEVFPNTLVQSGPFGAPVQSYRFAVQTPLRFVRDVDELSPLDCDPPQVIDFRLVDWANGGEVAHYELDSKPPKGWRWSAYNGRVIADRVPVAATEEGDTNG